MAGGQGTKDIRSSYDIDEPRVERLRPEEDNLVLDENEKGLI